MQSHDARQPPSSQKIRWGIIGLGDVTATKSGPPFYKCAGSELVAVMRRTPGAAAAWIDGQRQSSSSRNSSSNGDIFDRIRPYDDLDAMLRTTNDNNDTNDDNNNPLLDAVYIAAPPGAHLSLAKQVARSPTSCAAYIEKPVGRCAWETRAIVDEFESRTTNAGSLPLFTAYVSRSHERTSALIQLLSVENGGGCCGERVASVRYRMKGSSFARGLDDGGGSELPWRLDASQAGGGLIMDVGCHVVDRIDYLFGPIVNVEGVAERRGTNPLQMVEDFVRFKGVIGPSDWSVVPSEGATVECSWDFCPDADDNGGSGGGDVDELIIEGPGGSLRMAAMGPGLPIRIHDAEGTFVREVAFEAPEHSAQPMIQAMTDELLFRKRSATTVEGGAGCGSGSGMGEVVRAPSRGDNAIRTSEVLDAALNGYYGGRHDEFWSRPETWPGCKEGYLK